MPEKLLLSKPQSRIRVGPVGRRTGTCHPELRDSHRAALL